MCELLGFSFNGPINPNYYLEKFFFGRAKHNPDGWGIAHYLNNIVQITKEPQSAEKSNLAKQLIENSSINSNLILAHIRKLSVGVRNLKNTHPFHRHLNGKDFIFTHNGTFFDYYQYRPKLFTPYGKTDSEHMFCYLLDQFFKDNLKRTLKEPWGEWTYLWLNGFFKMINRINKPVPKLSDLNKPSNYNKVNCMLSDGRFLLCYKDSKSDKSLCFLKKKYPFKNSNDQDLDGKAEGYIIASKKLTDEPWEEIDQGELVVFKNGTLIFRLHQ